MNATVGSTKVGKVLTHVVCRHHMAQSANEPYGLFKFLPSPIDFSVNAVRAMFVLRRFFFLCFRAYAIVFV